MRTKKEIIICTSGGFDPVHVGHIRMFRHAKRLGDVHIVILNNDNWLMKKRGKVFMPERERKEILETLSCVDRVILTGHPKNPEDMSVCDALAKIRPHIFANGGDRTKENTPEKRVCKRLGIRPVYNVGGGKIRSSSELLKKYHAA